MVKTLCFQFQGEGFSPWSAKIPYAVVLGKKKGGGAATAVAHPKFPRLIVQAKHTLRNNFFLSH